MDRLEAGVVVAALDETGWNEAEAARLMQMPRRTLAHRIEVLAIRRPDPKD